MSEFEDPLEQELATMQPVSPSPEMCRRIAQELSAAGVAIDRLGMAQRPQVFRHLLAKRFWWQAIGIGLAACLAAGVFLRPAPPQVAPAPPDEQLRPAIAVAFDDAEPSLWTYRRALVRSEQALEETLDQHSVAATPRTRVGRDQAFIHSASTWQLHGEL